eukprot:GEMP01065196.1.p1 GENE.GEMP01065196.1~~GEMP01065196.1.p1  ORF type:complete len:292 (+),score=28.41 GEMP01065196.1:49-924(+)
MVSSIVTADLSSCHPECITPSTAPSTPVDAALLKSLDLFETQPFIVNPRRSCQSFLRILEKVDNLQRPRFPPKYVASIRFRPIGVVRPCAAVVVESKARRTRPAIELSRRAWEEQSKYQCPLDILPSIEGMWSLYRPIHMVMVARLSPQLSRPVVLGAGSYSVSLRTGAWFAGSRGVTPVSATEVVAYAPQGIPSDPKPWNGLPGGAHQRWLFNVTLWIPGYQLKTIMVEDLHLGCKPRTECRAELVMIVSRSSDWGASAVWSDRKKTSAILLSISFLLSLFFLLSPLPPL